MSLLCLHGVDMGIKTENFVEVSKFVMELAKVTQPPNRPIVGDKLYDIESGIIAGWFRLARKDHPLEYIPFAPELVGQKPVNIVLGKNSGPPSMEEWCEKLGIKATDEERMAMLQQVKAKSFEKKDLLTADEFKAIADRVMQKTTAYGVSPNDSLTNSHSRRPGPDLWTRRVTAGSIKQDPPYDDSLSARMRS